ncbi:MAG: GEVED domain-containing protein, partial [Verrucomicrobia bacterium]|nr:GEVED domain-containing protein [Verrucomicrobiota bacterium]
DTNNDPDEAGMVITTSSVVFRPDGLSSYFDVEQLVELPVTNITGSVAKIGVFIDVNSDGDFDDADEQSFNTVPGDGSVIIRSTLIKYKVPAAPPAMNFARYFAMRCRITTDLAVGPDGVATDGEVIDKVQQLQFSVPAGGYDPLDLGDHAGTYPTLRAINGARHVITPDIFLGTLAPDGELDGQPSALADGDDTNGVDDENAVNASSLHLIAGFSFNFPVLLTNAPKAPAVLTGFFDWNNNGVFEP